MSNFGLDTTGFTFQDTPYDPWAGQNFSFSPQTNDMLQGFTPQSAFNLTQPDYSIPSAPIDFSQFQVPGGGVQAPAPQQRQQDPNNLLGLSPGAWRMMAALGIPLAIGGAGQLLGQQAGSAAESKIRDIQRQFNPTVNLAQQRAANPEPTDLQTILNQMQGLFDPRIRKILEDAGRGERNLSNQMVNMGMSESSPMLDLLDRSRTNTTRSIADALIGGVQGERQLRAQTNQNSLATAIQAALGQQNLGVQGVDLGIKAAGAAGQTPANLLLLASILGGSSGPLGKGGVFGG